MSNSASGANANRLKIAVVPVTPFEQNCSLVWDEATKAGAVIDPGGDVEVIEDAIRQTGIKVERIVLTHGHIDHAGGADELRAKLGVKVEGPHIADKFLLEGIGEQAARMGIEGVKPVTPDRWLAEGETVTIAAQTFEIFHCPGHSPGSVVLFNRVQRFAFVGDVLFRGSIGRTDFPYGNHDALITAIKTKLLPLGDDIAFICGHGPTSTFGRERQTNPFIQ